ncbi:MAG: hypothetical protein WBH31_11685 [Promethearchaeia archaeon]
MCKCHICKGTDFNEVLILKREKFRVKGTKYRDVFRVCFRCARKLAYSGDYRFGYYWTSFLLAHRGVF